jgi:hypothetical protein
MASLVRVPEPIEPGTGRWRPQLPRVPREIRADFLRVGLTAAAVWSVAGLFLSVVPSYVRVLDATGNLALVGATTSVMLAASCAAQVAVRRGAPPVAAQAGGLVLLTLGLLALVLAAPLHSGALVVAGAALAGVGHGVAFLAAQHDLTRIAPADRRAEVTSAFYTCIYLGVALPVIGAGVIASAISLTAGIAVFGTVTGAASLALAAWHLRRGSARPAAPGSDDAREERP